MIVTGLVMVDLKEMDFKAWDPSTKADYSLVGEVLADTWLGHHIDGWDPYAPESSSGTTVLDRLLVEQDDFLRRLGFSLQRNPLV